MPNRYNRLQFGTMHEAPSGEWTPDEVNTYQNDYGYVTVTPTSALYNLLFLLEQLYSVATTSTLVLDLDREFSSICVRFLVTRYLL